MGANGGESAQNINFKLILCESDGHRIDYIKKARR